MSKGNSPEVISTYELFSEDIDEVVRIAAEHLIEANRIHTEDQQVFRTPVVHGHRRIIGPREHGVMLERLKRADGLEKEARLIGRVLDLVTRQEEGHWHQRIEEVAKVTQEEQ